MESRVIADRYRLENILGEGGMARVFQATDLNLGRPVAVKILHEHFGSNPEFVERFEREARSAAGLSHPNIVAPYDMGTDAGLHYIVMEWVDGETLKSLIQREAPLRADRVVSIGTQIADALEHAHGQGIIHRDVKPQNVLVTPDGRAKVMDFGIAAAAGETQITRAGSLMGTPDYISPERALGGPVGPTSDVYSAGLVLYEMATGRLPFRASDPIAVARMHIEDPPPRPSALNERVPRGLEAIILTALAKDPSRRFATAGELAGALREYAAESSQSTQRIPIAEAGAGAVIAAAPAPAPTRRITVPGREAGSYVTRELPLVEKRPVTRTSRRPVLGPALAALAVVALLALALPRAGFSPFRSDAPGTPVAPTAVAGARATAVPAAVPASPSPTPAASLTPTPSPSPAPTVAPTTNPQQAPEKVPPGQQKVPPGQQKAPPGNGGGRRGEAPSPSLQAALDRVSAEGYEIEATGSYDESETLRALVGRARDKPNQMKAFFFLGDDYLGTDTLNPSGSIGFQGQDGNTITIAYDLYRPDDPMENPTGGTVGVRYSWNGSRLTPLDPIPPDDPQAPLSRR